MFVNLRRFSATSRLLLIGAVSILIAGCGGAAAPGTPVPRATAQQQALPAGAYSGSYTLSNGSPIPVIGAFVPGQSFIADAQGDVFLLPAFDASGQAAGNATAAFNCSCGLGGGTFPVSASATGAAPPAIAGTFTHSIAQTGSGFSGSFQLTPMSVSAVAPGALTGTYYGFESDYTSRPTWFVTISNGGGLH